MSTGHKATLWICAALVIGAVTPLLALLAAAFGVGCWWASLPSGQPTKCDPQLMSEIKGIERQIEHQRRVR